MLKTVQGGKCSLNLLGDLNATIEDITSQATMFMCSCYNITEATTMTEARIKSWLYKTGRKSASKVPELCTLPPTVKAFEENAKRAHYQCAIWRNALQEPPQLDPTKFGWSRNENTKSLEPVTLPSSTTQAPDYVLKLVCFRLSMCF